MQTRIRRLRTRCAFALLAVAAASGCASPGALHPPDRFEPVNRPIFGVNEGFDDHLLGPVARRWIRITPLAVRDAISRAYHNLTFPDRFVSCVAQGELVGAGSELARFLVNSSLGIGGFLDPGSELGVGACDEDVGRTLARWGVPAGPYVVIPFLGPSAPRDVAGGIVDLLLNPLTWTGYAGMGAGAIFAINGRAQDEQEIAIAKKAALDYYVFVRDSYIQQRVRPSLDGGWWDESLEEEPLLPLGGGGSAGGHAVEPRR